MGYKLGAKNAGDAEASFRVLPSHITVADSVADAEIKPAEDSADAPKDKALEQGVEDTTTVFVLVASGVVIVTGLGLFVFRVVPAGLRYFGVGNKRQLYDPVGVKAKRVGRFSSATRY